MTEQPKGPVRPNQIYVSRNIYRALGYLSKSSAEESMQTRDGAAEQILSTWFLEQHPEIIKFLDEQDVREKEFVKGIKPKPPF